MCVNSRLETLRFVFDYSLPVKCWFIYIHIHLESLILCLVLSYEQDRYAQKHQGICSQSDFLKSGVQSSLNVNLLQERDNVVVTGSENSRYDIVPRG